MATKVSKEIQLLGHEVGFIVKKGNPDKNILVAPLKFSIKKLPGLVSNLLKIRKFIGSYDIVVCYDINPGAIALNIAALGKGKKIVAYAIGTYSLLGPGFSIKNLFMRWAYNSSQSIFIVSDFLRRQIEKSGYRFSKYKLVPVGVDTGFFKKTVSEDEKPPFDYILSVGALKYRKGYHLSIPAFALIAHEFPSLKYIIIGDHDLSSYYNETKKIIAELGLEDRVILIEKITDEELIRYYNSALFFILTSVTTPKALEGFGMVYLEAGACGKAVIGALDSGAEDAIENNVTGLLVRPEPSEIAMAMQKLLVNKELCLGIASNGLKRAAEFDWSNIAKIYLKNFTEILNNQQ